MYRPSLALSIINMSIPTESTDIKFVSNKINLLVGSSNFGCKKSGAAKLKRLAKKAKAVRARNSKRL